LCRMVSYDGKTDVAEIKLPHIKNVVDQASRANNISRIMLFGSALEERCTDRSDIDLAVFGSLPKAQYLRSKEFREFQDRVFLFDLGQDYDILYFSDKKKNTDSILRDISRGAEIYRRDAS